MTQQKNSTYLVFDWDLTLSNPWPLNIRTLNVMREKRGLPAFTYESYREQHGFGHAMHDVLGVMFTGTAENNDAEAVLLEEFENIYLNILENDPHALVLMPGAKELIEDLAAHGFSLAINSAKPEKLLRAEIRGAGVEDCFIVALGGDTLKDENGENISKPDPRALFHVNKEFGATPGQLLPLVVIGDSAADMKSAAAYKNAIACLLHSDPDEPEFKNLVINDAFANTHSLWIKLVGL